MRCLLLATCCHVVSAVNSSGSQSQLAPCGELALCANVPSCETQEGACCPTSDGVYLSCCHGSHRPWMGAHYARIYDDFPESTFPDRRALVVTSRDDGLHFFKMYSSKSGELPALVGSFRPSVGIYRWLDGAGHFSFDQFSDSYVRWSAFATASLFPLWVTSLATLVLYVACVMPCCCVGVLSKCRAALATPQGDVVGDAVEMADPANPSSADSSQRNGNDGLVRDGSPDRALFEQLASRVHACYMDMATCFYAEVCRCSCLGLRSCLDSARECRVPLSLSYFSENLLTSRKPLWRCARAAIAAELVLMLIFAIHEFSIDRNVFVAMEGQAKYGNVFVALAICKGSSDVKYTENWRFSWWPCPKVLGEDRGGFRPILYVFDLDSNMSWTHPQPQYAIPLRVWRAALHVQLVVMRSGNSTDREGLYAVVSSGFSQGLRGLLFPDSIASLLYAAPAAVMSLPIAWRNRSSPNGSNDDGQDTSSFQFKRSFGHSFKIDVSAAFDGRQQDALAATLTGSIYPEGVLVYQPDVQHGSTYVLTAGVVSTNMNVVNISAASVAASHGAKRERYIEEVYTDKSGKHKQLVGRTFYANDGKLYAVAANFAKNGGIEIFDLNAARPVLLSSVLSTQTGEANRVVLAKEGKDTVAVVPLENSRRFVVYNVTDPRAPYMMMKSIQVKGHHTYCLEIIHGIGDSHRVVLINDEGEMFCQDLNLRAHDKQ